jgi:hypothetical protein
MIECVVEIEDPRIDMGKIRCSAQHCRPALPIGGQAASFDSTQIRTLSAQFVQHGIAGHEAKAQSLP